MLAGPIGSAALHLAASAADLRLPAVSLGGAALVKVLLIAPVLEEIVFRGGVQRLLERAAWGSRLVAPGVTIGNVLTSVIFAAAHLSVAPTGLAAAIFLPSLVFGRLAQLYRTLLPAMLVHAVYNACYLGAGVVSASRL